MKILNRLAQITQPSRPKPKVIEGKKKGNYQKQCGLSNSSISSMLKMMSTFTTMMGFACFMSNLINSIKQDSIKQAYPGSIRHQLNSLIGFSIVMIILGIVQVNLQTKKKSKYYFGSQVVMIPIAFTMIILSSIFYDRIYHPLEKDFTQEECEKRVKRVFAQKEQLFQYYEQTYNQFCSETCPCSLEDQQLLSVNKRVYQGTSETWVKCPDNSKISNNESYNELLEQLEEHYNCAGLCEIHDYFTFKKVNSSLPKRSCIVSVTEEFNLIAESTIAINVISSVLMTFFSVLFLLIHKKIFYIWSYKLLKQKAKAKLLLENSQSKNNNQQSPPHSQIQSTNQNQLSSNNSPKHQVNTSYTQSRQSTDPSELGQQQKLLTQEITRQDLCDWKDECERLERVVSNIKQGIQQNGDEEASIKSNNSQELEEAIKMHQSATRYYQSIIRQFQTLQKRQTISSVSHPSPRYSDVQIQFENLPVNQQASLITDQVIIDIPVSDPSSQLSSQKIIPLQSMNEASPKSGEKQKSYPKTELQVIEEEMRQFDSVS